MDSFLRLLESVHASGSRGSFPQLAPRAQTSRGGSGVRQEALVAPNLTSVGGDACRVPSGPPPATQTILVKTKAQAVSAFEAAKNAGVMAINIQTVSLDPHVGYLTSLQVSYGEGITYFMNFTHPGAPRLPVGLVIKMLGIVMAADKVVTVAADLKAKMKWLIKAGITKIASPWDVLLAAHVLDGSRDVSLGRLALEDLGMSLRRYKNVVDGHASLEEVPFTEVLAFGGADVDATLRLYHQYRPRIDKRCSVLFYKVELPMATVLASLELEGIGVDAANLQQLLGSYKDRQVQAVKVINRAARQAGWERSSTKRAISLSGEWGVRLRINPYDQAQITKLLVTREVPLRARTRNGNLKVDGGTLEDLIKRFPENRLLTAIQEFRLVSSLAGTHVKGLLEAISPVTGRIHPTLNQFKTKSFRLSCSSPNLQNVPRRSGGEIRSSFVPRPGHVFVRADLNQIELRVLGHLADEARMKEAFAQGDDLHIQTARECLGDESQRDKAKSINFGRIYGQTEVGLAKTLGISTEQARRWQEKHARVYPGIPRYHTRIKKHCRVRGYVKTLLGGRRYFTNGDQTVPGWERAAYNHPVQGTAGELFKFAMARVHEAIKAHGARIVLTIHDEIVVECPRDAASAVGKIMEEIFTEGLEPLGIELCVPLEVEWSIQDRWGRDVEAGASRGLD